MEITNGGIVANKKSLIMDKEMTSQKALLTLANINPY